MSVVLQQKSNKVFFKEWFNYITKYFRDKNVKEGKLLREKSTSVYLKELNVILHDKQNKPHLN